MKFTTHQISGHGRGKLLGFPTINMEIPAGLDFAEGIYAVWVTIANKIFKGALHYGPVPVFGQKNKSLEVFLLDAQNERIGDTSVMEITIVKRLRDIRSFPDSIALVAQITQDVAEARAALEELAEERGESAEQ